MDRIAVTRKYLQHRLTPFSGHNDVFCRRGGDCSRPQSCANIDTGMDKPHEYPAGNADKCRGVVNRFLLQLLQGHITGFHFGSALFFLIFILSASAADAGIVSRVVPYQSEGMQFEGYLAHDGGIKDKRPGVLVIHEWWGLNDAVRKRVDRLAAMGYVAFALDLYGKGKTTTNITKATKMLRMVQMNGYRWRQRGLAGLEVLRGLPQVDPQRIAAIGYGWGGATLQQLIFNGTDIKGAVLFGSFVPSPATGQAARMKAKLLVLLGAADPYLDIADLTTYIGAMEKSRLDWQLMLLSGAKHGFTDPSAAQYHMKEFEYNQEANRRSWRQVEIFLNELFQNPEIEVKDS